MDMKQKQQQRTRRHSRVRAKIRGTNKRPRLCVFRSNQHLLAQLIDDISGTTLLSARDQELPGSLKKGVENAYALGELLALKAQKQGIERIVFDRGGYQYHGKVRAMAEGARKGGLKF